MKENVYVCYEPLCCEGGGADIMAVFKSENKAKDFVQRYNMGGVLRDARYEKMELD